LQYIYIYGAHKINGVGWWVVMGGWSSTTS